MFKLANIVTFSGGFVCFCLYFVLNLINVVVSNKSMVADKKGGKKLPWRHVNQIPKSMYVTNSNRCKNKQGLGME